MALTILLSACGGESGRLASADTTVAINESRVTKTINRSTLYDLVINGSGNTITISGNNRVNQLTISGDNNLVTVLSGTTIENLTFSGNDNTVSALSESITTETNNGRGNKVNKP